jgi:hypothetical protein
MIQDTVRLVLLNKNAPADDQRQLSHFAYVLDGLVRPYGIRETILKIA